MAGSVLQAGPLSAHYLDGDLRSIRLGDLEIIRRIYVVFQDRNWTARPWWIEEAEVDTHQDSFTINVRARGTFDAAGFTWHGQITGTADGSITYQISGSTCASFPRNRLGLCVLHPIAECVGQAVVIEHSNDTVEATRFPQTISAHQPFLDIRAMTHQVLPGLYARVSFSGEIFETEDHRNWSDASYKTYCTPISLPFPVLVDATSRIEQQVTVTLEGATTATIPPQPDPVVTITGTAVDLPQIGLQIPRGTVAELTAAQVAALTPLALHHLRVDIDVEEPEAGTYLKAAAHQAEQLQTRLWVALYARRCDDIRTLLEGSGESLLTEAKGVDRWIVLDPASKVSPSELLSYARQILEDLIGPVRILAGTDLYFTELNRQPLTEADLATIDGVTFTVNPQVHASDDISVLQNVEGLRAIAQDAPRLAGGNPIVISPLSLRPRFNPNATEPEYDVSNTPLPSAVDARQRTWFGAAWLLLSLRALAETGTVEAVTVAETIGWRGVMAEPTGSPDLQHFPCAPDETFPIGAALADIAGWKLLPTHSTRPDLVQALALERDGEQRWIVINLDDTTQQATLDDHTYEIPPQSIIHEGVQ
jgi:hypothetical protein